MIRLNLSTDYALRTLLYLASRGSEQASCREVAAFYGISGDHVAKVVQHLAHAGMVRAGRGRGGGLRLGRATERISVGEVVELFEGPVALLECVTREGVCRIQPGCRLRHVLDAAGSRLIQELKGVTLADLVPPGGTDGLVGIDAALTAPLTERQ
jgi:Rrf2 family transcriptional regulator, nitric oxide-sensitive transcriptional repressor